MVLLTMFKNFVLHKKSISSNCIYFQWIKNFEQSYQWFTFLYVLKKIYIKPNLLTFCMEKLSRDYFFVLIILLLILPFLIYFNIFKIDPNIFHTSKSLKKNVVNSDSRNWCCEDFKKNSDLQLTGSFFLIFIRSNLLTHIFCFEIWDIFSS